MGKSKSKAKKVSGLDGLYQAFLSKLSSGERESIEEKGIVQAMPAFRKYLMTLSEMEMTALVSGEEIEAPELIPGNESEATPEE